MNEFDDVVSTSINQAKATDARIGFSGAADTNPDAYAEDLRIARRTGLPVPTVANMPQEARRQDAMGRINFDTLAIQSPSTAAVLADLEKAKVSHDDVDNMSGIETALSVLKKTGSAAYSGIPSASAGILGLARAGVETFVQPFTNLLPEGSNYGKDAAMSTLNRNVPFSAK